MEGDAGPRQLNPTDAGETPDESLAVSQEPVDPQTQEASAEDFPEPQPTDLRRPSRLGRGWVAAVCAGLLVLAGAGGVAGYLVLKSNRLGEDNARAEATALQAAKDCVTATHAPDTAAMTAAQSKIIECSPGDFGA
jgi:Mce-associated membrane protein